MLNEVLWKQKKKDQKRQEGLRRLGMCNYFVIYKTVTAVPQQYNANHRVKLITSSTASFSLSSTKRPTLRRPYWQKTPNLQQHKKENHLNHGNVANENTMQIHFNRCFPPKGNGFLTPDSAVMIKLSRTSVVNIRR